MAAAADVHRHRSGTVTIDDLAQLLRDLVERLLGGDLDRAAALALAGRQQPIGMVDALDLGPTLRARVALGDGVVAITPDNARPVETRAARSRVR